MSQASTAVTKCARCERALEQCACCQEPDCPSPICYTCLSRALGQSLRQPYAHGD